MFSDIVKYTDWDDNPQTERLWFNITKTDLLSDLQLMDRATAIQKNLQGPKRELTTPEKQEILDVVKSFMKMAYGIKSADGKHFRKSAEIWSDFSSTAAYDEYLLNLFINPEKAFEFITNAMPKDLREAAAEEAKKLLEDESYEFPVSNPVAEVEPSDPRPQWLIDGRVPTEAELKNAPREYLVEAFKLQSQQ